MSRKEALERGKQEADEWYENYCKGFRKGKELSNFTTQELLSELELRENYHIAREIRNIRHSLGLTMKEFATKIDDKAGSGTVGNWEMGRNKPNKQRMKQIKKLALDCNPS